MDQEVQVSRMWCSTYGTAKESLERILGTVAVDIDFSGEEVEGGSMAGRDYPSKAAVLVEGISETA